MEESKNPNNNQEVAITNSDILQSKENVSSNGTICKKYR